MSVVNLDTLCWWNPSVHGSTVRPQVEAFLAQLRPPGRLPEVSTSLPVEDWSPPDAPPTKCSVGPTPGMALFRRFVLEHLGGIDVGICACRPIAGTSTLSNHSAGKAWDWGVRIDRPDDVARVNKLFDWLLKNNAANFKRVGLTQLIWNRQVFSSSYKQWTPYRGVNAHVDHVHFSIGDRGASASTSFFRWLGSGGGSSWPWWPLALGAGVGLGATIVLMRYV